MVSALFALAAKDSEILFVFLAYFPALAFWGLDGYFLHQERLFRALYDHVRSLPDEQINFSMDTSQLKESVTHLGTVVLSKTLVAFHGVIVISLILVTLITSL